MGDNATYIEQIHISKVPVVQTIASLVLWYNCATFRQLCEAQWGPVRDILMNHIWRCEHTWHCAQSSTVSESLAVILIWMGDKNWSDVKITNDLDCQSQQLIVLNRKSPQKWKQPLCSDTLCNWIALCSLIFHRKRMQFKWLQFWMTHLALAQIEIMLK